MLRLLTIWNRNGDRCLAQDAGWDAHESQGLGSSSSWHFSTVFEVPLYTMISPYHVESFHPFSLKEELGGFFWSYLNGPHYRTCMMGTIIGKRRASWIQALWYSVVVERPNKATLWQKDRSCAHWTKGEWVGHRRLHHTAQNEVQFKTYELFASGNFHLILLDCCWRTLMEAASQGRCKRRDSLHL